MGSGTSNCGKAEVVEVLGQGHRFPSGASNHQVPVPCQERCVPAGFFCDPYGVDELLVTVCLSMHGARTRLGPSRISGRPFP